MNANEAIAAARARTILRVHTHRCTDQHIFGHNNQDGCGYEEAATIDRLADAVVLLEMAGETALAVYLRGMVTGLIEHQQEARAT